MSRTSLTRPRRNRAVWDRPANGTRLLQSSSSYTVSPGIPLPGDGRSIDSTRHTLFYGHSRDCAHTLRRTTPAHSTGEADRPYYTGLLPGAIAPPAHSPVAYLGVLPSPSDGSEDALPPPLCLAERMWDLIPFLDSPVVPLGEPHTPSDGSESALPTLRMVERVPWTDMAPRRDTLSPCPHLHLQRFVGPAPADIQPPAPLSPGPSIAYPSPTHITEYTHPPIGGRPCPEEAAGPEPAHPKETTTPSSTAETPGACGNLPPSSPSSPTPAAPSKGTPRKPGSPPPSPSPPLWTAFPSTPSNSPTPPCRNSIAPSKPFSPPNSNGQGKPPDLGIKFLQQSKITPESAHQSKVMPQTPTGN